MTLRSAARTDVGRARGSNEDSVFVGGHVFAVADGLGGHRGGEVASALAIDAVKPLADRDAARAARELAETVRTANKVVLQRARHDPALTGMGTTITAVVVDGTHAHLAHVGDSRAYLLRDGSIEQLTQDHTMVARLVRDGRLTPEEAERHPQRSMLTRALGSDARVDVDEIDVPLSAGDRLLLCSDGLTNMLTDGEIAQIVHDGAGPDEICVALVDAANAAGGIDNITAVLIEVDRADGDGAMPVPARTVAAGAGRSSRRAIAWTAIVLVVLLGTAGGLRVWANASWYVGAEGEEVVVVNGLPFEVPLLDVQRVDSRTGIALTDLPDHLQRSLRAGIEARSADHAKQIVRERLIPQRVMPEPAPAPDGSPGPAGSGSPGATSPSTRTPSP